MPPFLISRLSTVSKTGAPAGSLVRGCVRRNQGLVLRLTREQARGDEGPVAGPFLILDAGDNASSPLLAGLLGRPTDAAEVLRAVRPPHGTQINVVNANILIAEGSPRTGSGPGAAPGPEGVVSDPDF